MAERLARLAAHLAPRTVDGSAPAPAWATSRWSQAAGAAGPSPFDAVASEPLTWTRALAAPLPYREGPLSPRQWREFWEDGWTVLPAPREAVDTAALLRILEGLVEKSAQYHLDSGRLSREQLFEGEGILRRQAAILEAAPGAAIGVQPQRFLFSEPMKKMHTHPAMVGIVHQLTGAAELCLTSNYALRSKAPSRPALDAGLADGGTVPWHQCVTH